MKKPQAGFTIVELLIVIVVIAILAAISIVAYNGIQQRARDSQRVQDIKAISKAIEMYYLDSVNNGLLPSSTCTLGTGCKINSGWNTTADSSWSNLESQLVPKYISSLPKDPLASTANPAGIWEGYNYDYARLTDGTWCSASSSRPMYLLAYRLESGAQKREFIGGCSGTQPTDYSSSEYMVIKN